MGTFGCAAGEGAVGKVNSKLLWFDTETTGIDHNECAIWQLSGLVEIDGRVVDEFDFRIAPFPGCKVEEGARKLQDGRKWDVAELREAPSLQAQLTAFKSKMGRYVNKFDRDDKFVPCGFNVHFDIDFLIASFKRCGDKYFGSWFFWAPIDVRTFVGVAVGKYGQRFKDYKLKTICDGLGISLDAHDALSDIKATRDLYLAFGSLR